MLFFLGEVFIDVPSNTNIQINLDAVDVNANIWFFSIY